MIKTANEFVELRKSDNPDDYHRTVYEKCDENIWSEIIDKFPDMKEWVVLNKTIPLTILKQLAQDKNPDVRYIIASKRSIDDELVRLLSIDPDESVRQRLAYNPRASKDILLILSEDSSNIVKSVATQRLLNMK